MERLSDPVGCVWCDVTPDPVQAHAEGYCAPIGRCDAPDWSMLGRSCDRPFLHTGLHFAAAWWFDDDGNTAYDGTMPADIPEANLALW